MGHVEEVQLSHMDRVHGHTSDQLQAVTQSVRVGIGRTPLTTPGLSRDSSSSEIRAEPRQAGLGSSRPRLSSSTFWTFFC